MARRGRGRRTGGGQGFGGRPDQFNASGRVRTARGGTRNRGGALATTGGIPDLVAQAEINAASRRLRARERAFNAAQGSRGNRTINVGGGTTSGGGIAARGGSRRRGSGSGADNARSAGAGRSGGRLATSAPRGGGGGNNRRANAIRELARRGATQGERNAARAAAARLGIRV